MKRTGSMVVMAALAISTAAVSSVHASFNATTGVYTENTYYDSFGTNPIPAGVAEYGVTTGFGGGGIIGDYDGRVISNAAVVGNGNSLLNAISPALWLGGDANLYKVYLPNPSLFSAAIATPTSTDVLALFDSTGKALSATIGGTVTLNASNDGITAPGTYYIGTATAGYYPANAEGQNIFGLTATPGYYSPVTADSTLSTSAYQAWTLPGTPQTPAADIIGGSTNFLSGSGANILITGVPEPTCVGLLGLGASTLLGRRRKAAR